MHFGVRNIKSAVAIEVPQTQRVNLPSELVETLLSAANLRIERIISFGHTSPEGFWYDQQQHEWAIVLWTTPDEPTIWLAIHYA